jgi:transcriptional regulator with XRE-family HTH domain
VTPKEIRQRAGLTQAKLAHAADMVTSTVQAVEEGRSVRWNTLRLLSMALGISVEEYEEAWRSVRDID